MRLLIFSLIVVLTFSSCTRRSGRRGSHLPIGSNIGITNNSQSNTPPTENDLSSINPNTSNQILTGSEIFERFNNAVFMVYTSNGNSGYQGSGFFITPSGVAVSNYHVFKGTTIGYEELKLSNGSTYKIEKVLYKSPSEDVIVFKVRSQNEVFDYIPITSHTPKVGEQVFAIGSPRGLENTFSSGEISQFRANNIIQISVPIDHGSSGGALINEYGEVIGITSGGIDESSASLNFAINISVVKKYLNNI